MLPLRKKLNGSATSSKRQGTFVTRDYTLAERNIGILRAKGSVGSLVVCAPAQPWVQSSVLGTRQRGMGEMVQGLTVLLPMEWTQIHDSSPPPVTLFQRIRHPPLATAYTHTCGKTLINIK